MSDTLGPKALLLQHNFPESFHHSTHFIGPPEPRPSFMQQAKVAKKARKNRCSWIRQYKVTPRYLPQRLLSSRQNTTTGPKGPILTRKDHH